MVKLYSNYLAELIELKWSEFVELEKSDDCSSYEKFLIGMVRAFTKGVKKAITEYFDRLDGKVADNIEINYPKFYFRYPYATGSANGDGGAMPSTPSSLPEPVEKSDELPTGKLRPALEKMLEEPMSVVKAFIHTSQYIDETGKTDKGDPSVKGVMVAFLVDYSVNSRHSVSYASEILEQIEGKVAQSVNFLGGDVHINKYDEIAPEGAYLGEDGVYVLEMPMITSAWTNRIEDMYKQGKIRG